MEEYDGQLRPGTLLNLLIALRQLRLLRLLGLLGLLSVLRFKLSFNEWSWQIVDPMQINNYLREVLAVSRIVCYTHYINTGQIGACARG